MRLIYLLSTLLCLNSSLFASEADTLCMEEVVVTGSRATTDVRYLPVTVSVVSHDVLTAEHQPSVLPTLSRLVPGMFVTSRAMMGYGVSSVGAGALSIRGISGTTGQLLVLIDGHPQYNGVYGHPIGDAHQTLGVERVEVLRGPASVLYGSNAMGGVLNIVTRQMQRDGVHTNVTAGAGSYGTVETQVSNQVRSGKFSSMAGLEYNRSDNHRERMDFSQYGGSLKLGYDFSEHWKAAANADVTHFDASAPGTLQSPLWNADQWITRGAVALSLENKYEHVSGGISVFTSFGRHKIDDGTSDPVNSPTTRYFRSRDNLAGISLYESARLFKGNHTTFGFDYQHIYGKAWYTDKVTKLEVPSGKQSGKSKRDEVAGYIDFRQDVVSWLTLDAGLRADHHSVSGTELIPQGGIVARPILGGELKATVSKGFRNPTMRELYLYAVANENLEPERMMNYELAWSHRLMSSRFSYGVNLFYLKADNLIQRQPDAAGVMHNENTGEVENVGFEVQADYQLSNRWNLHTHHSYLHMETPVLASPTYKGLAGFRFHEGRWTAQADLQYVAGLYKAVGASPEKENFCLLSASVNHRVWKGLKLWLRIETLIGERSYEIVKGYPLPNATVMGGFSWDF